MIEASIHTPLLLVMFNRPDHTQRLIDRLREIQPINIYVAIDGPRHSHPTDAGRIRQILTLLDTIDWPCTVKRLIRDKNMGCKQAVSSAITWFFDNVEQGIILEDDCLPDPTFFDFCHVLLEKYIDEPRVMHIGGANLYGDIKWGAHSYFFSNIAHIWGWATWRRAWNLYDVNMQDYPIFKQAGIIDDTVTHQPSRSYWRTVFDSTYAGTIDTWDYQWIFTIWKNKGLTIIPNQNLVTNIGFDEEATHTISDSAFANLPTTALNVSIMGHPEEVYQNHGAVDYAFAQLYHLPSWWAVRVSNLKKRLYL